MATLSLKTIAPKNCLSKSAIPQSIREAVHHIFSNCGSGIWLVGGTALAGYYAEHRRSDDIDLFAADKEAHRLAVLAVKSLSTIGAMILNEKQTPLYYRAQAKLHKHSFTIDIVLDEQLHKIGRAHQTSDGVYVADIPTLLAMKAACLISRCSEKDLFDLNWLFENVTELSVADLIKAGNMIDAGISVETLLISLKGTSLREDACRFLLPQAKMTAAEAYRQIKKLQKRLISSLLEYEKSLPRASAAKALSQTYQDLKKLRRSW